jgi:hypothetical protein
MPGGVQLSGKQKSPQVNLEFTKPELKAVSVEDRLDVCYH